MKLNIRAIVIAETIVAAALFILCRLAFAIAPEATLASLKYLTHIDWSPVTMPVTFSGFISGLVVFTRGPLERSGPGFTTSWFLHRTQLSLRAVLQKPAQIWLLEFRVKRP